MTTKTQCNEIISWLQRGHSLTAIEALDRFGCSRLAARIGDLRKSGHEIKSKMIKTVTGKRVAEYRLVQEALCQSVSIEQAASVTVPGQEYLFEGQIEQDRRIEQRFAI